MNLASSDGSGIDAVPNSANPKSLTRFRNAAMVLVLPESSPSQYGVPLVNNPVDVSPVS
jgi:hypothetical protein